MKWAIIKDNKVVNIAVADEAYAVQMGWVPLAPHAGIGWDYIEGTFIEPLPLEITQPTTPTKEELLTQLQALQAQIQSLE